MNQVLLKPSHHYRANNHLQCFLTSIFVYPSELEVTNVRFPLVIHFKRELVLCHSYHSPVNMFQLDFNAYSEPHRA